MSGLVHLLSASVVSSVALRPSTVYVLRVENARSRGVWHVRRCFADFCELRDKLLAAATAFKPADGGDSSCSSSRWGSGDADEQGSPISGGSANSSPTQPTPSPPWSHIRQGDGSAGKYAFLLDEFPTRRRFWSRSIVRRRATTLNAFLQQTLQFAREVRASQQIAVYFSVMTHLEAFFECAKHADDAFLCDSMAWGETVSSSPAMRPRPTLEHYPVTPVQLSSQTSESKTSKWRCAADCWRGAHDSASDSDCDSDSGVECPPTHHGRKFSAFQARRGDCSPSDDDKDVDEELLIVGMERAGISRQFCPRPRIFHPFENYDDDEVYSDDERDDQIGGESDVASEDDGLDAIRLRKAASAILPRETREMRLHYTGSHYAPLQKGQKEGMTASAAWAARVEIAGIREMASKQDAPLRTPVPIYLRISRTRNRKSFSSPVNRDDGANPLKAVLKNDKAKRVQRHHLPFGRTIRVDRRPECA